MSYLSVLSPDLSYYLKCFIYKRLFPPNLSKPPTLLLNGCSNIKSLNDEIYIIDEHYAVNINTGVHTIHTIAPIADIGITTNNRIVIRDTLRRICFSDRLLAFDCTDMVVDVCIYILESQGGVSACLLGKVRWSVIVPKTKRIVNYDTRRLLFLLQDGEFVLVNKLDGTVGARACARGSRIWDAVVDDEGKILLMHDEPWFSLWDATLQCLEMWRMPTITKVCLHNHALLFINTANQVMLLQ